MREKRPVTEERGTRVRLEYLKRGGQERSDLVERGFIDKEIQGVQEIHRPVFRVRVTTGETGGITYDTEER